MLHRGGALFEGRARLCQLENERRRLAAAVVQARRDEDLARGLKQRPAYPYTSRAPDAPLPPPAPCQAK